MSDTSTGSRGDDPVDPIAQLDQALRGMKDVARVTWAVYSEHRAAGFTKAQAFELAKAWFVQSMGGASAP